MKSITLTYFFLLLIVGLFLFSESKTEAKSIESNKVKSEVSLIDSKPILTTNLIEEKTQHVASNLLESFSILTFKDFNALLPQKEQRNQFRKNFRFETLRI